RGAILLALEALDGRPLCDDILEARFGLTRREITIARLVGDGRTNQEIATALGISLYTARNHTARVLDKLDAPNRASVAARLAGRPASRRAGAA
ncbi:MAG TPA: helix-turn-helix transcriptional regulator, partial [Gemmatimonadales bacterium]|nr:helix-turn-helix transcriptional regulator [Gemmatimonadales bacterium]